MQTLKPFFIESGGRTLVEIPVTTFPLVKTPIHASYLNYLAGFSTAAAKLYWHSAVTACSATGVEPSFLLHPLDFLGGEDVDALKFFPGMGQRAEKKIELISTVADSLCARFDIVSMREHARRKRRSSETPASAKTAAVR